MKTLINLLSITFILLIATSCETEELPVDQKLDQTKISADTGDQHDEMEDRKDG